MLAGLPQREPFELARAAVLPHAHAFARVGPLSGAFALCPWADTPGPVRPDALHPCDDLLALGTRRCWWALNLRDDSPRLTTALAPAPSMAAALHQLWQLAIAAFRDALAMWECQSACLHGLLDLRNICICLRFSWANLTTLSLAP
jgi:hypothetical protein